MKVTLRKILGISLMSLPLWFVFWALGIIMGAGMWEGFLLLLFAVVGLIGILDGCLFILVIVAIGEGIYKGESLGENKWLKL